MAGDSRDDVGPVLQAGRPAEAVIAAIRELNPGARVVDRGAYLRVLVPWRCVVTRECVERHAREDFAFPSDLEMIMSSFKGRLSMSAEGALWEFVAGKAGP